MTARAIGAVPRRNKLRWVRILAISGFPPVIASTRIAPQRCAAALTSR